MLRTALKPRWLLALLLALVVSGFFVALSIWQAEQSVSAEPPPREQTETPVALTEWFEPYEAMLESQADQMVTFTGAVDPEYTVQVSNRLRDGETGFWLVSLASVDGAPGGVNIPIVWGWTADEIDLNSAEETVNLFEQATGLEPSDAPVRMTGRVLPADGPAAGTDLSTTPLTTQTVATSELVNLWDTELYAGYVAVEEFVTGGGNTVVADNAAEIEPVAVAPPPLETEVIWLNVFYAIEWIIFAGMALYLWWRFVRDDYLKDRREAELDKLWHEYWTAQELEKRREKARHDKAEALAAYRAYYGTDPEPAPDSPQTSNPENPTDSSKPL